jgi:hypothetical protein
MVGLTESGTKRGIPDALVMTKDLGAVGFCYSPETHAGKHPADTFVVKLTRRQMREIALRALEGSIAA